MISIKNIVLGSKSPRRQELLKSIITDFEVITKEVEEIIPDNIQPNEAAKYLAELKASAYQLEIEEGKTIITSDTVVINDNKILGKPIDANEAFEMLSSLSGKTHEVYTGVCIIKKDKKIVFDELTKVTFKVLSVDEINYYITNYKPFDKAGSYGIQEWIGMIGVTKVEGCFYNVMGFPVAKVYKELLAQFVR